MNWLSDQVGAIEKLNKFKVGALFMEPGTGKTRAARELVKVVKDVDYVLWLTPFRTKQNLAKELQKWGGLACDIVGIETLSASNRTYLQLVDRLERARRAFVVCDETLKIKNWEAIRTQRIVKLGALANYRLVLNGTPMSRNILDLWAQFEFLSPKILDMGLQRFKDTFCEYVTITKSMPGYSAKREYVKGHHNIDYLYSLIHHYVYEADLKLRQKKSYKTLSYELGDEEREEYYRLKHKYLDNEKMLMKNNNIFLELTQKMQHGYCCTEGKFRVLDKLLEGVPKDKVLIFTKYIVSRKEVQKRYPDIKVLSFAMHSFGLNMQDYHVTVFFDKTWDYAQRLQAELRTYRVGQDKDCMYYDLTGDVGLEVLIDDNIDKKISMLEYFKSKSIQDLKKEL